MKPNVLTQYANETLQKHASELPKYIIDQLQVVIDTNQKVELFSREKLNIKIKHQEFTDQKKEIMGNIYDHLKVSFAIVQTQKDDTKKQYFSETPSAALNSSGELMLDLLKNINARIEKDPDSPLINYKEQMISDQDQLDQILTACYDTRGNGQAATAKKQEAVKEWNLEYVRLKGLLKYALLGNPLNYRIFFRDLTLTASKPETEEDVAALEDLEELEKEDIKPLNDID